MARIVIDARIINSSTGRYVERLLAYLQDIDKQNKYIVLVRQKDVDYWKPTANNFKVIVAEYDQFSLGEQFGFALFLYKIKADLVHFCMPQQPILYFKPSVTTMHDLILLNTYNSDKNWLVFHFKQLVGRFVFLCLAHKSRFIITPSDFTRQEYLKRYRISSKKVITTHLAADTDSHTPEKMDLPYKKFIMYVGQQSDYKNIHRLVQAHQQLLRVQPDLGLILVGGINDMAILNQAWVEKNNYQNVLFTGYISDEKLAWLYQHTAAYVFPSLMEGFGLPGLEAMSQGAPVVSSNTTSLPEVYGEAAHYFDPMSVDDMANKISDVMNDEGLRATLVKTGFGRIKNYSWKKTARQTYQVYMEVLGRDK